MKPLVVSLLITLSVAIAPVVSGTEIPQYTVLNSEGNIQVRRYEPMILAEVVVTGDREAASRRGFRLIADFIFGNNQVQQDIAMTAPVQQQRNQKIAMTAPVQQQSDGDNWQISFVMPSEYTLESLPQPNSSAVVLREIPAQDFIVIRFAGRNTQANVQTNEARLRKHMEARGIVPLGPAKYAFYNAPWTPPFFRRNEVMFEIDAN